MSHNSIFFLLPTLRGREGCYTRHAESHRELLALRAASSLSSPEGAEAYAAFMRHRKRLCAKQVWELNPLPSDYKSDALPTELTATCCGVRFQWFRSLLEAEMPHAAVSFVPRTT